MRPDLETDAEQFRATKHGATIQEGLLRRRVAHELRHRSYDPEVQLDHARSERDRLCQREFLASPLADALVADQIDDEDLRRRLGACPAPTMPPWRIDDDLLHELRDLVARCGDATSLEERQAQLRGACIDRSRLGRLLEVTDRWGLPVLIRHHGGGESVPTSLAGSLLHWLQSEFGMDADSARQAIGLWLAVLGELDEVPGPAFWSAVADSSPVHLHRHLVDDRRNEGQPGQNGAVDRALEQVRRRLLHVSTHNQLLDHKPGPRMVPLDLSPELAVRTAIRRMMAGETLRIGVGSGGGVHLVAGDRSPTDLSNTLQALKRANHSRMVETGTHSLRLAIGHMLYRREAADAARAPLMLLAVDVSPTGDGSHWQLTAVDGQPEPNLALAEFLRGRGIDLDGLDPATDPDQYLQCMADLIVDRNGWHVVEDIQLDLIATDNDALAHDTDPTRWRDVPHPPHESRLLQALLLGDEPVLDPLPDREAIDEARVDARLLTVAPSDEAQLGAILAAAVTHQDLVIHGPPGTGKTTTIANLIAHLLAEGQRVLVVSQTPAALEVLHDRARRLDLGDTVLALYGKAAHGGRVARHIANRLELDAPDLAAEGITPRPPPDHDLRELVAWERLLREEVPGDDRRIGDLLREHRERELLLRALQHDGDDPVETTLPDLRLELDDAAAPEPQPESSSPFLKATAGQTAGS